MTTWIKKYSTLLVFLGALAAYTVSAGVKIDEQTRTPQYVYLAHSFLQGRLDLVELPASTFDLIQYEGRYFVPGGMAPAILLMPIVAIFGLKTSDILFGVVIGAINVALAYSFLKELNKEKPGVAGWLTVLFAFGTAHWWVSSVGSVWFNAHLVALMFMLLHVKETFGRNRPWLAGIWFGMAALARPTILFGAGFYLLLTLFQQTSWRERFFKLIPFGLSATSFVAVMLGYNYLRFSHPMEFGYGYVVGTRALTDTYARTGGFSPAYMPCNMYVSIVGLPNLAWSPIPSVNTVCSYLEPVAHDFNKAEKYLGGLSKFFNPLGMSIFLTTPAFLLIFRNRFTDKRVLAACAGALGIQLVLWMYHTTGWVQFGYRYSLDFQAFLFILLSYSVSKIKPLEMVLTGLSILMGFLGLYLMYFMTLGLFWNEMITHAFKILLSKFGLP